MWELQELFGEITSAAAAISQANAAWWAALVSVGALVGNTLVALVAVRGPERERWVRDLEDRKRRARLYVQAARAGQRALGVANDLERHIRRQSPLTISDLADIENFKRRLDVRRAVLLHFLGLELRETNLVGWLHEVATLMEALRLGISVERAGKFGEDPFAGAADILVHRSARRRRLASELRTYRAGKYKKDNYLQMDLDQVTKIKWLFDWKWQPSTPRD